MQSAECRMVGGLRPHPLYYSFFIIHQRKRLHYSLKTLPLYQYKFVYLVGAIHELPVVKNYMAVNCGRNVNRLRKDVILSVSEESFTPALRSFTSFRMTRLKVSYYNRSVATLRSALCVLHSALSSPNRNLSNKKFPDRCIARRGKCYLWITWKS